jgi:hypothetical protein
MDALLGLLPGVAMAVAIGAWLVAAWSMVRLIRMMPAGYRLSTLSVLGRWRFDIIRAQTGPAAEPLIRRFQLAGYLFFAAALGGIVLAAIAAPYAPNSALES